MELRYRLSALVADQYCAEGFTTVVQDNIYGNDVLQWLALVAARPRHLVVLRPSVDVVQHRDEERRRATGKVAYRDGGVSVEDLDRALAATPHVGLWIDSSHQTPEGTVAFIRRHAARAVVDGDR